VIVAARNATGTIEATLESLLGQTLRDWEAVVVDDGSTDDTASVVAAFSHRDERIRLLRRSAAGTSVARNHGIDAAQSDWLLFLDADDWLAPVALEALVDAVGAEPGADGAYGGYDRVDDRGGLISRDPATRSGDLFVEFARTCLFAIHACVVRRALVERLGGFDPELVVCQDWDLWQRVCRTGARFVAVPETVALYRARAGSASMDPHGLVREGLRLIDLGHSADPRVAAPSPEHALGAPRAGLPEVRVSVVLWACGLALGQGLGWTELLSPIVDDLSAVLSPYDVAERLFQAVPIGAIRPLDDWPGLWASLEEPLDALLERLEEISHSPRLARRARRILERLVCETGPRRPLVVGLTTQVVVELTAELRDVPAAGERLRCELGLGGVPLGTIELPICDGLVPATVIADVAADLYAWEILGAFLAGSVYPALESAAEEGRAVLRRGEVVLASAPTDEADALRSDPHGFVGWTVFLQELWDRRSWTDERFYDPDAETGAPDLTIEAADGRVTVEVALAVPDVDVAAERLVVSFTAGGSPVAVFEIPGARRIAAQELRVAALLASGFEACRVAVRQGLLGSGWTGASLRERLREAAARGAPGPVAPGVAVLERRPGAAVGTSVSRWAALPADAWPELEEAARVAGERIRSDGGRPTRALYAPDVVAGIDRPALGGGEQSQGDGSVSTDRLPILMYHRIADGVTGPAAPFSVAPAAFEEQLAHLRDAGYSGVSLDEWRRAVESKRPLAGRRIAITFDDGYADFLTDAWPLLERFGFTATVFLVAGRIGGTNDWDSAFASEVPLLDWPDVRKLQDAGVSFGAHTMTHPPLTGLGVADVVRESARARSELQIGLGRAVTAFAYPYGDADPAVKHLIGACGYTFGLTTRSGRCELGGGLLDLPRIDVPGDATIERFVESLAQ
jgi:peptidoglycan/xylan/chitin deacetylase (PgdA/CDA1 family)